VARGEAAFAPNIVKRLIRYFSSLAEVRAPRAVFPEFTDREREILDLIAAGKDNQEIAGALFLSLKTVRNYVSNIFAKLQVGDRT
jgi:DNA-binding NarL/FixJ family response regulator